MPDPVCPLPRLVVRLTMYRYRFDFPVLLAEIIRHELPLSPLRQWLFVDTLAILDATQEEVGPCRKLQCLVRHYADPTDLRAHRATARVLQN